MSFTVPYRAIGGALAALALTAAAPAGAAVVAFTGVTTNDTPPAMPSPLCGAGQVRISVSAGNATVTGGSNFGAFSPTFAHCLTPPPTTYSGGVFDFAFAAGDQISGTYSGFFMPTATPDLLNTTVNYVVTGGTGRFAGATGTIQGVGLLDRSVPRPLNSLTLTGSLNLPAVPEPATWSLMIVGFGFAGSAIRRRRGVAA